VDEKLVDDCILGAEVDVATALCALLYPLFDRADEITITHFITNHNRTLNFITN
jgi:hypothetical protein